ncbi:S-adenosyl-L-methionine-dependent methyltransferase [Lindgomyces ingoldianus]|uniref:S-adenosyl-L-methionine-dependent methyltransferase n=1 Tax=Lindgomyces ingoldianus TaxID=673940 RepID=A0ACB6QUJ7_9PLEO|nr:S-adenosyl-L-methionine-dependent methyltransferase [Lindgomyces ingoldianus]KAF2470516.1 S-adenosyl-L-methionine-dependent methyltransferase [Lindgomyces ingoldianus]
MADANLSLASNEGADLRSRGTAKDKSERAPGGYSRHWEQEGQPIEDDDKARDQRKAQYTDLVNDYYDATTDIYLEAWGESFHFCRFPRGPEPKATAISRHEHYIAHMMGLQPGMRVLDVGCGVGGPAKEIASYANCSIVGLNNNAYQVKKAQELAKKEGMDKSVEFVKGDFMTIPFPSNSFDAVYVIEATVHAPSLEDVYSEIFRVLKPGGTFGVFEWVMTDKFDSSNRKHMAIRLGIERGNGIPTIQTKNAAREAMRTAGFELTVAEDLAERDDPVGWWYVIAGDVKHAQSLQDWSVIVRNTKLGRVAVRLLVRGLEFVRYAPKGTAKITEELIIAGDALVLGGTSGVFTPMYLMVGKKPEA